MSIKPLVTLLSAASIVAVASIASPPGAQAMPIAPAIATHDHPGLGMPGSSLVEQAYWRRGWGWRRGWRRCNRWRCW
jgi:hypothetical protein